jgi:hypothetical protein
MQHTEIMSANFQVETAVKPRSSRLPTPKSLRVSKCKVQRRDIMNRKTSAIAAVSLAWSVLAAQPAKAQVVEMATGIAGDLLGGVLFGVAPAANPATSLPSYYGPQLPPPSTRFYAEEQPLVCRSRRVHAWDGYGWYYRRIEVCG